MILISLAVLCGVIGFGYSQYHKMVASSQALSWRLNWGFDTPSAKKVTNVFYNGGRDPDYYYISEYDEEAVQQLQQLYIWNKVGDNSDEISSLINGYKEQIQQLYQGNLRYGKLFLKYPVHFNQDSLYFTRKQEDGSYIVAVLNVDQRRLYTLEIFY